MKAENSSTGEDDFRSSIVSLILDGRPEDALQQLAKHFHVSVPRIKVGLPKGHRKNVLGCYTARDHTISVLNGDILKNPVVVLHEFYHHLRTRLGRVHRGTEGNAMEFAKGFIQAYNSIPAIGSGA
jgi:hypothetical protein